MNGSDHEDDWGAGALSAGPDDFGREPPRTSGMAIGSLVLGLVGLCFGVTALIGLPLGIAAMISIRRHAHLQGFGLALAGTIVSAVVLPLWALLGFFGFRFATSIEEDVWPQVVASARELASSLEAGDVDAALAQFGEEHRDAVRAKLARIAEEHGAFERVAVVEDGLGPGRAEAHTGNEMVIPYSVVLDVRWPGGETGELHVYFHMRIRSDFRAELARAPPFRALELFEAAETAGDAPSGDEPGG